MYKIFFADFAYLLKKSVFFTKPDFSEVFFKLKVLKGPHLTMLKIDSFLLSKLICEKSYHPGIQFFSKKTILFHPKFLKKFYRVYFEKNV